MISDIVITLIVLACLHAVAILVVNVGWYLDRHDGYADRNLAARSWYWNFWLPPYLGRKSLMRRAYDREDLMIEEYDYSYGYGSSRGPRWIELPNNKIPDWYKIEIGTSSRHLRRRTRVQSAVSGFDAKKVIAMDGIKAIHAQEKQRRDAAAAAIKEIMEVK